MRRLSSHPLVRSLYSILFFSFAFFGTALSVPSAHAAEVPVFGPETFTPVGDDDVILTRTFNVPRTASGNLVLDFIIPANTNGDDGDLEFEDLTVKLNGTNVIDIDDDDNQSPSLTVPVSLLSGANTLTISLDDDSSGSFTIQVNALDNPPTAAFTATPLSGPVPLTVTFDASSSTDAENNIATYAWDFGEPGAPAGNGITASHTYTTGGTFTVTLTVTDVFGLQDTATGTVEVISNLPPTVSIDAPAEGAFVIVNRPEVRLSYSDDKEVDTTSIVLTANGQPLTADCTTTAFSATCTPTQDLPEGNVILTASVSDLEGETTTAQSTFFVDSIPVEVAILSPEDQFITTGDQITVTGAISPNVIGVEINGVTATITGSTFTATVPLREGKNMLVATGRNVNGKVGVGAVDVTRDIQKPIVRINSPRDGFVSIQNTITITGIVNDIVSGGVEPAVKVNSINAPVVNGTFILENVPLGKGPNPIEVVATDAAGNFGTHSINVEFQPPVGPRLLLSSGNGQSGTIGQTLLEPLTVQILDDNGNPVPGRVVRFEVTRNNGTIQGSGIAASNRIIGVPTDGSGKASVNFTLGNTAGGGNNRVRATSVGVAGEIEFCATGLPEPPDKIIASMGQNQRGVIGEPLPIPLEAFAADPGGNPVEGLPVTFTVATGSGNLEGQQSLVRITGADGIARAVFTLGYEPGINNNVATATFEGHLGLVATFTASGIQPGDPANTTFSGVVLDASQQPIPDVTVFIDGTAVTGLTDVDGRFLLTGVPVGAHVLHVVPLDPSALPPGAPRFPPLEFEVVTISGVDNTVGMPIILPQIATDMEKLVGGPQDVVLEMKGVPGAQLTVLANSATFPGGSTTGLASVSQVHMDQVPMQPPNGSLPPIAGTLQPVGAKYDPPVRVQFPNISGLPPGTITEMYQFHHDTSRFVPVGKGTVTEDGRFLISDPGFGLQTGGWHIIQIIVDFFTGGKCNDNDPCSEDISTPNGCVHQPDPDMLGKDCKISGGRTIVEGGIPFHLQESCTAGKCSAIGKCEPTNARISTPIMENEIKGVVAKLNTRPPCMGKDLAKKMFLSFMEFEAYQIECLEFPPEPDGTLTCAQTHSSPTPYSEMQLNTNIKCLAGFQPGETVLHEMHHGLGGVGHVKKTVDGKEVTDFSKDPVWACQKKCFHPNDTSAFWANVTAQCPE